MPAGWAREEKGGPPFLKYSWRWKTITCSVSQFIEALHSFVENGGGQQNPSEPIGRGRMERSGPAREGRLSDLVKMMVFDRSYIWGQVTAITGTRRALKSFSGMKMTRNWHHIWGEMKLKSSAAAHFTCWWAAWPHQSHNHTVSRGEQSLQRHQAQLPYLWGVALGLCFRNDVVKSFNTQLETFQINVWLEKLDSTSMHGTLPFCNFPPHWGLLGQHFLQ